MQGNSCIKTKVNLLAKLDYCYASLWTTCVLIILICAFHVGCLFIFHKVHCSSCQSASGEYSSGCSLLLLLLLYFFTIVYIFNLFRSITVYLNVAGFSSPTVVSCQCTAVCSTLLLLLGMCARAILFWARALFVYLIDVYMWFVY